jgi:6-phosphogluconolactonase
MTAGGREIVYVGSNAPDIAVYSLDTASGALALVGAKTTTGSIPSFMAVDPTRKYLYAVNEYMAQLVAFSIDRATGGLTMLNKIAATGDGPAFIGVDRGGKYVLVANYNAGSTAIFKIGSDGMLGSSTDTKMPGMNAHMILTDPSNQFAFVPCLGSDYIAQYRFDPSAGTLTASSPPQVTTKAGAGPRHIAFHPTGPYAYLINEKDSTMNAYTFSTSAGTLTEMQSLSTLPPSFTGQNKGAEVVVSSDGKFVYGSNRGHDTIAIYYVAPDTGKLALIGNQSTGGAAPRSFNIDPSGNFMLVANQDSDNVVTFKIDRATGTLRQMKITAVSKGPEFVGAFVIPPP